MVRKLLPLLLLVSAVAYAAAFTDDFNRTDEALDASANWTKPTASGAALAVTSNQVATSGTNQARRIYVAPDNGSADYYVQADQLTGRNNLESLVIRAVDDNNFIGTQLLGNGTDCEASIWTSGSETVWDTEVGCNATALRIEAEGTTIRFYYDSGSGMTLFHTQSSVTQGQTEQSGGFATTGTGGTGGTALWDNFETDVLATAPAFSVAPSCSATTNGVSCTYTADSTSTAYGVGVAPGDGAPTCTQIQAGQNDGGTSAITSGSDANTGTADTITVTGTNKPPKLDYHFCLNNANGDSAVDSSQSDKLRSADSGQTIATISATLSTTSIFDCTDCVNGGSADAYFDPDFSTNDVIEHDSATNEDAGCTVAFETDGDFTLTPAVAGDCDSRRSFDISYEDVSSATDALFTSPTDGDFATDDTIYVNDPEIVCDNEFTQVLVWENEDAPDSIDLDNFCSHSLDTLSYAVTTGTLPTDVSLTGATGVLDFTTYTTENEAAASVTFTATNDAEQTETIDFDIYVVASVTMPNCVNGTVSACFTLLEAAYPWDDSINIDTTAACSESVAADNIISQTPTASTETSAFPTFTAVVSTGACTLLKRRRRM